MHYQITEEEFNCLDAVRGQIAVMAGMLSMMNSDLSCLRSTDLHDAIEVQRSTLQTLLQSLEKRGVMRGNAGDAPQAQPGISPALLVAAMRAASGEEVGQEVLKDINAQLCDGALQGVGYGDALRAYYAALGRQGYAVETRVQSGTAETTFERQRPRLPVQAPKRKRSSLEVA